MLAISVNVRRCLFLGFSLFSANLDTVTHVALKHFNVFGG
jgi:hypothetical protein